MTEIAGDSPNADAMADERDERWIAGLCYVLFLIGPANGLTMLIGAIIAFLRRENAPTWLKSHYDFQIATLIYPLLFVAVAIAVAMTIIGLPIALLALAIGGLIFALWVVIRAVIGLVRLVDGRPNPDPRTAFV